MQHRARDGLALAAWFVLAAACGATRVNSAGLAQPAVTVSNDCLGPCLPSLTSLTNGTVAATWASEDGRVWVQLVDSSHGLLLGPPVDLGRLNASEMPLKDQPLVVAGPDGDLVIVGVLADGRISFVRGSRVAERRVAPRIVVEAEATSLLGVAASADSEGVVLLLLRRAKGFDLDVRHPSDMMIVELYTLGAGGEPTRAPIRYVAPSGFMPTVQRIGSQTLALWRVGDRLLAHFFSDDGPRSERSLKLPRDGSPVMGGLVAQNSRFGLFVGWRAADTLELQPELLFVELSPDKPEDTWRTSRLPAPPVVPPLNDGQISIRRRPPFVDILVKQSSTMRIASVDVHSGEVSLGANVTSSEDACVATWEESVLCAVATREDPKSECPTQRERIELWSPGQALRRAVQPVEYWAGGELRDVDRRSPADRSHALWLTCEEPEFAALRSALTTWCKEGPQADPARREEAFCTPDAPTSLLFQVVHCRDYPVSCPASRHRPLPSVDRLKFERGERVELWYMSCYVAFELEASAWTVVDAECTGD